jgi:hypothetical protein
LENGDEQIYALESVGDGRLCVDIVGASRVDIVLDLLHLLVFVPKFSDAGPAAKRWQASVKGRHPKTFT